MTKNKEDDTMIRWWCVSTRGIVSLTEVFVKPGKKPPADTNTSKHYAHFVNALTAANDAVENRLLAARMELERQTTIARNTRNRWRRDFGEMFERHDVKF